MTLEGEKPESPTWVSEGRGLKQDKIRYSFTDETWIALGWNVFSGTEDHTFFRQFNKNDNVYATVRYGF